MKILRPLGRSALAFLAALLAPHSALNAQSAGTIDASLNANITGSGGNVSAIAVQPDGNIIIAGLFSSVGGVPRGNIARISQNGTLDMSFNPNTNGQVNCAALQPDGSIVIGGSFTSLQPNGASTPTTRNYAARLNPDGSLDPAFNPNADAVVYCAAVQADGKIVLGGFFQFFGFSLRQSLARFNANGSLDTNFSPQPDSAVFSIIVRSDGELLVGGQFSEFNSLGAGTPVPRHSAALLFSDGTVDKSFDPEPSGRISAMALQPNGQVILGGDFDHLQPNGGAKISQFNIARVNANGSLDTTFAPNPGSGLDSLVLQTNGQIVISGGFTNIRSAGGVLYTRNRIARLNADGSIDTTFDPSANGEVDGVALLATGEVLIGGAFTSLQPDGAANSTADNFLALLNNDLATQSLTTPDSTQVQWLRGGASPEATAVTFEQSPDGETWFPLGSGTRITGGWQLTGLNLSGLRGTILALAQVPGGQYVSSPGTLVDTAAFDFDTVNGFTVTPTLTAPASNSATKSPVTVNFTLPETALSGSVKLKFGANAQTLVLTSIEETAGTHTFTFNPADPVHTSGGAVASIVSGNIPDLPNYAVTLSYQDTLAHPSASVSNTNIDLDTVTQAPFLTLPQSDGSLGGPFGSGEYGIILNLPETALPGSVQLTFDNGSTQYVLTLTSNEESAGYHVIYLDAHNPVGHNRDASSESAVASGPASIPDGVYAVSVTYQDFLANASATSNVATDVTLDTTTQTPSLSSPASNSYVNHAMTVAFNLPEAASSVTLSIGNTNLTLNSSLFGAGDHRFNFDPADPADTSNGAIDSGSPVSDGSYTVKLSYSDALGNPPAQASSSSVIIDTTAPTIQIPVAGLSPLVVYAGSTLQDYTGQINAPDVNGATVTQSPQPGGTLDVGQTEVTLYATDPAQNQSTFTFDVTVRPTNAVHTVNYTTGPSGDAPPGAGAAGGPPGDAKLASFGTPAIDASGHLAFLSQWTSATGGKGKGLFTDLCLAKVGDDVPGVTGAKFKSFSDPVIDSGSVAMIAAFSGVPSSTGSAVVSYDSTGAFSLIAREGGAATTDGAKFKAFKEIAITDGYIGILAQLATGTGSAPKTTAANAIGLWVKDGSDPIVLVLREGQAVGSTSIKKLVSFAPGNGSPGQGRGWLTRNPQPGARVLALCLLANKTQAIVSVDLADVSNLVILSQSGVANGSGSPAQTDATFAAYGLPTVSPFGESAFLATLTVGPGSVTKSNAKGLFADLTGAGAYSAIAQVTSNAGATGARFSQIEDPVLASDGGLAFPATIKGGTVKGLAGSTLWWQPFGQALQLLAQGGTAPGDLPGAQWKAFTSLAIAANRGPIFSATLVPGKGGMPKGNPAGVWAVDFLGQPRLLFRTGMSISAKTLKSFTLLNATVGSTGVTRTFNDAQQVVWLATFTDKTQAIVTTETP